MFNLFNSIVTGVMKGVLQSIDPATFPQLAAKYLAQTELRDMNGLVARLEQNGLGPEVASWLGSGPNLPVTAEQLRAAIGENALGQFAAATGVSVDTLLAYMADLMPSAIDRMSPNGALTPPPPEGGAPAG